MSKPLDQKSINILSPLRYPGAKRRLGPYLADVLRLNSLSPKLFIEPFAGSLSISLQLLHDGLVENIALGEKDPLVASFWKIAFNDTEWLKKQIRKLPVTVDNWRYFKETQFKTDRQRAKACLFLNRTSFSGILSKTAGPIGGFKQESDYKIDCRFNVEMLIKRLDQAAALKDKVLFIENISWEATIDKVSKLGYKNDEVFFYFDPPFYKKADKLYRYFFVEEDHQAFHDKVMEIQNPWLLSYDAAEPIIQKYGRNGSTPRRIGLLYSTGRNSKLPEAEELIITNLEKLPTQTQLWSKTLEKKSANQGNS